MKTFDFDHPDFKKHHPYVQGFLRRAQGLGMTEEYFVATMRGLPKADGTKGGKSRTPSKLRTKFRRLQRVYNFFGS